MRGPVLVSALCLLSGLLAGAAGAATAPDPSPALDGQAARAARADSLHRAADARLAVGGFDERRIALQDLEQAVLLAPDDPRHRLAYGRLCLEAGFEKQARQSFERAAELAPGDGAARLGMGQIWKRDWLEYLEPASLAQAVAQLSAAVERDPGLCDAWVVLAPLLYEHGESSRARAAAERACGLCPDRAEARLAAAYLAYRAGQVTRAESLFTLALPGLPPTLQARFADLAPLLSIEDGEALDEMGPRQREEFVRRFWSEADPDAATPENEARLEFWSRVAHASLLFLDPSQERWDARAELYVRYGSPGRTIYELAGAPEEQRPNKFDNLFRDRFGNLRRIGEPMWYPLHSQLLIYPDLGMTVLLQDLALSYRYQVIPGRYRSNDPVPDPSALARNDLLATAGGRAVFPALPPGVRPLQVAGCVARFEGAQGTKLLAQIEAPGTPVDELWAQCVLVDSSEHVVSRLERTLSPSGCDPTALRTGDFTFDVPPGVYRVAFSVRDGHGGRGVTRSTQQVAPVPAGLAMSDVVVTCGPVDIGSRAAPEIRLGPNLKARVAGEGPLIAYFEIYRMTPGADGQARFAYEYAVESEERDARTWFQRVLPFVGRDWHYVVHSEESNVGPLRRQFISVPVQSLKPGHYRLDVKVRDLATGQSTTASARFERVGAAKGGA
jgi:GWxTD domain-containing protein